MDLELELLRVAAALEARAGPFDLETLVSMAAQYGRLAQHVLHDQVPRLAEWLVHAGYITTTEGGYQLTEHARALLARQPLRLS